MEATSLNAFGILAWGFEVPWKFIRLLMMFMMLSVIKPGSRRLNSAPFYSGVFILSTTKLQQIIISA